MKYKKENLIIGVILIIVLVVLIFIYNSADKTIAINNFQECMGSGNPVMESYPRQCSYNGNTFVEDIGNRLEKNDLIRVTLPTPNQIISSPFSIQGEARGYWFFEGSFPITIQDANGKELLISYIDTQDNWMTENFISFDKKLSFETPKTKIGKIILQKSNPSGLQKNDDQLIIPVRFSAQGGSAYGGK